MALLFFRADSEPAAATPDSVAISASGVLMDRLHLGQVILDCLNPEGNFSFNPHRQVKKTNPFITRIRSPSSLFFVGEDAGSETSPAGFRMDRVSESFRPEAGMMPLPVTS